MGRERRTCGGLRDTNELLMSKADISMGEGCTGSASHRVAPAPGCSGVAITVTGTASAAALSELRHAALSGCSPLSDSALLPPSAAAPPFVCVTKDCLARGARPSTRTRYSCRTPDESTTTSMYTRYTISMHTASGLRRAAPLTLGAVRAGQRGRAARCDLRVFHDVAEYSERNCVRACAKWAALHKAVRMARAEGGAHRSRARAACV